MTITSMTTKGQIVIPSAIRKRLNITRATRLCIVESEGRVILQPVTEDYFDQVAGIVPSKGQMLKDLLQERRREKEREDKP
jgi:AbrB family looped-hinge helix DNA binding protein